MCCHDASTPKQGITCSIPARTENKACPEYRIICLVPGRVPQNFRKLECTTLHTYTARRLCSKTLIDSYLHLSLNWDYPGPSLISTPIPQICKENTIAAPNPEESDVVQRNGEMRYNSRCTSQSTASFCLI